MAETKKKIVVRVPVSEGFTFYRRNGFTFQRGGENIVEATPEQIAALRADPLIAVGDVEQKPAK